MIVYTKRVVNNKTTNNRKTEVKKMNKVKSLNPKKYENFVVHDMDIVDKKTAEFFYCISSSYIQLAEVRGSYRIERYKEEFGICEYHFLNDDIVKIVFDNPVHNCVTTVFVK